MRVSPLSFALTIYLFLAVLGAPAQAQRKQALKLENSRLVFEELFATPDRAIPEALADDSKCIAVLPHVVKGAFVWGGRHGNGVLSCRGEGGSWSPPAFIEISGGSFGFQIGGQSTDFVLFFMTERGARSLLSSKFTMGGDASVAAGPFGREALASTDIKLRAEIYSYARTRGLFAGVSLEGSRLAPDQKAIEKYYGEKIFPEKILFDHQVPQYPPEARNFVTALP